MRRHSPSQWTWNRLLAAGVTHVYGDDDDNAADGYCNADLIWECDAPVRARPATPNASGEIDDS